MEQGCGGIGETHTNYRLGTGESQADEEELTEGEMAQERNKTVQLKPRGLIRI